ncbi:MAG: roadblock/LC7 domain-containing protein [Candidatus Freyarchaeota archaeon]|nr:roadblock/LC7 domain-containing protein [Candidatus Jordarchaeia archaeon]
MVVSMGESTEEIIASIMDKIPEIEGIILFDTDGNALVSQTITQMRHAEIAKNAAVIIDAAKKLSQSIEKGDASVTYVESENGFTVVAFSGKKGLLAITGKDATNSLGLIMRNLKLALSKIK